MSALEQVVDFTFFWPFPEECRLMCSILHQYLQREGHNTVPIMKDRVQLKAFSYLLSMLTPNVQFAVFNMSAHTCNSTYARLLNERLFLHLKGTEPLAFPTSA